MANIPHTALTLTAALGLAATMNVHAEGLEDGAHGEALGAHVHGEAHLNLALDGKFLVLEFSSPGANVFGFEHAPRNHEEAERVEQGLKLMKQADQVFVLPAAAGCHLGRVELGKMADEHDDHGHDDHEEHAHKGHGHDDHGHDKHAHKEQDHHDEHKHHDHEEHAHKDHGHDDHGHDKHAHKEQDHHDEHKHHDHEEHAHEGHDHGDEDGTHMELKANYFYQCDKPELLNSLQVSAFKTFPAMEKIHLQLITPKTQKGKLLTPDNNHVNF